MKKTVVLTAAVLIALLCGMRAMAAGTTSNWKATLTFSMDTTADISPITIGEGAAAAEAPKPPALPGLVTTGNVQDAVIDAYVVTSSAAQRAMSSIDAVVANEPGRVWPIQVNVEKAGTTVSLKVDMTSFPNTAGFNLNVINPDNGALTTFTSNSTTQTLFTAATAGVKTLYVMAGTASSFVVSSASNTLVESRGTGTIGPIQGADVYVDGVKQSTQTNASGLFTLPSGLSASTHTVRVLKQYYLGAETTIDATSGSAAGALKDMYPGDFNSDGIVDMKDFMAFKQCYKKQISGPTDPCAKCDVNGDNIVDMQDLMRFKLGYKRCESWYPGCTQ